MTKTVVSIGITAPQTLPNGHGAEDPLKPWQYTAPPDTGTSTLASIYSTPEYSEAVVL